MSFHSLGLHSRILQAADDAGYVQPTPIQAKTIPVILKGRDVIGLAQTGTGKTAAFVLPLLSELCQKSHDLSARGARVLIIAPTRELVAQINQSIRTYGKYTNLRTAVVTGGASEKHQIEKLASGVDIVIATPGRLLALMDAGHCQFGKLTHLILDEADRMLDMGFIPDIVTILAQLPKRRHSLMFSATFPEQVQILSRKMLDRPVTIEVGGNNPAATVEQFLYPVEEHLKAELLLALLEDHQLFSVMVFVRTKEDVDTLTKTLKMDGVSAEAIHSDRSQNHRFRALRDFKENKIRVLVATDIAARGLDIPDVTHVINYDFPEQSDDYIHRIGRTGRAGSKGCALTFLTERNGEKLKKLERQIGRTLPKKYVDGFNYKVPAPEEDEEDRRFGRKPKPKRHSSDRFERSPRQMAKKASKKRGRKGVPRSSAKGATKGSSKAVGRNRNSRGKRK
jgi:ATP-dependent RNA helicase RhlE